MPPTLIPAPLAPILLPAPVPSSAHGRPLKRNHSGEQEERTPRPDEWWRFLTPTKTLALAASLAVGAETRQPPLTGGSSKKLKIGTPRRLREETKLIGPWRMGEVVGNGSTGKVRLVRHTIDGSFAAVKKVPKPPKDQKTKWRHIEREIITMKLAEHPRIVRLLDIYETPTHLYLINELCPYGELYHYLMCNKLSASVTKYFFSQLVAALQHLHLLSIAHRDIKPENLLLVKGPGGALEIKLADLGMACFQYPGTFLSTSCGSPHYAAPEIIIGVDYDGLAADIWSTGVVLFALTTGRLPFDDDHIPTLLKKIKKGSFSFPTSMDKDAKDLVSKMMLVEPQERIGIEEVANHPYLRGFRASEKETVLLPYPLDVDPEQAQPPTSPDDLDKSIMASLKVVLPTKKESDLVDAVLHEAGPQLFYVILRNFKTRTRIERSPSELALVHSRQTSGGDGDQSKPAPPKEIEEALQRVTSDSSASTYSQTSEPRRPPSPTPSSSRRASSVPSDVPSLAAESMPSTIHVDEQVSISAPPLTPKINSETPTLRITSQLQPQPIYPPPANDDSMATPKATQEPSSLAFPAMAPVMQKSASDSAIVTEGGDSQIFVPPAKMPPPRKKALSLFKIKELFTPKRNQRRQQVHPPLPLDEEAMAGMENAGSSALLPDSGPPSAPATPISPAPANPKTVKRSVKHSSLSKAMVGGISPVPSPTLEGPSTPPHTAKVGLATPRVPNVELQPPQVDRGPSRILHHAPEESLGQKISIFQDSDTTPTPSVNNAVLLGGTGGSSPDKRRRPTPLMLLSSNTRRTASSSSSNGEDPAALHLVKKASFEKAGLAPSRPLRHTPPSSSDPFSVLSPLSPDINSVTFTAPRLAPNPPSIALPPLPPLRGPVTATPRPPPLSRRHHHRASTNDTDLVLDQLRTENKLLKSAMELKDDEIEQLKIMQKRLSLRLEKKGTRCNELEGENEELLDKIRRMSFGEDDVSEREVDRRWESLMKLAEEGRDS